MTRNHRLSRRSFLTEFGGGVTAVAIFGLAACSSSETSSSATTVEQGDAPVPTTTGEGAESAETTSAGDASPVGDGFRWERVDLGFVSAYVIARGSELAIVDTGNQGSEGEILTVVEALGGTWEDVNHVIATHAHGDHVGSIRKVMEAAAGASGYAGADDISNINAPRDLVSLSDGDEVFGLQVIATPGHTPGSISVFDSDSGVLIAGDALNTPDGVLEGPNPSFSSDLDLANTSVQRLAELNFETLLVGHGLPIESGAGALVSSLAETL